MLGVIAYTANTPDCGPLGFMFGSGALNRNVAGTIVNATCQSSISVYNQQEQIARTTEVVLPLALLLLLPGWYKLLTIPAILFGVPGINFKDGSPVFRSIFFGGL